MYDLLYGLILEKGAYIMPEFTYDIVETLGVLSETAKGWTKELNLISWNGREPKLDIREWAKKKKKMGKGVTLTEDEAKKISELLAKRY